MNLKTRVTLWAGLLFLLFILLTGMGMWYVNKLKAETEAMLAANHQTVLYSQSMLEALDDFSQSEPERNRFKLNFEKQKSNLTEAGEAEIMKRIEENLEALSAQPQSSELRKLIRRDVLQLMHINTEAIIAKSDSASRTAKIAILWITVTGSSCFIIVLILLISLSRSIAGPVLKLIESTREIAHKNYSQRVPAKGSSEFRELAESFNKMAEKLEEYANSSLSGLLIEKKRLETIVNSMHDPIIGLDEDYNILFINKEALRIADLKLSEAAGKNIRTVAQENAVIRTLIKGLLPPGNDAKEDTLLKLYAGGKKTYFEKKYLAITIAPSAEGGERQIGGIIILYNVTAYKELDIAKTNFIASMSHNFKTPISSMQISLELLRKHQIGELNEEQVKLIEGMEEDAYKLLLITDELLKITEVESKNIRLKITSLNLMDIINYAIRTIRKQADQKYIRLQVGSPEEIPLIKGDAEKIAWVLINLISNAIRYSKENSTIRIQLKNTEETLHLSVEDEGQGISPEYKNKIFARYFRVPGIGEKGTGLGLAISKEFIEAQGGSIEVESSYGQGSRFTIILKKGEF